MEEPIRQKVVVPEKEATMLCKELRHQPELKGLSLSCYGFISKSGTRAIEVQVDKPNGVNGDYDRFELRYKADNVAAKVDTAVRNATKRILAHFAM